MSRNLLKGYFSDFTGRAVAGLAVGMLTMIVPMYMAEVATAGIRGTLVVLQQCRWSISLCEIVKLIM